MAADKFKIQSDQYAFPYHYLVDIDAQEFGRSLGWGLDYYTYMKKVIALAKTYARATLLDVGCGAGYMLTHLMRDPDVHTRVRAVGVDLDEKPVKFAQAFGHGLPNLSFRCQDIGTLDGAFDLITAIETFEHIPDDVLPGFVGHIDRLLEPGGHLLISVPSAVRPVIDKHYRHYTLDMLRGYFPTYTLREDHYLTARLSPLYHALSFLLAGQRFNVNFGPFKRGLLKLHEWFTAEVSAERGGHVVAVFQKPTTDAPAAS